MKCYKNIRNEAYKVLILIIFLLTVNCKSDSEALYTYKAPEKSNDGLEVGTLDEVNIDKKLIEDAVNKIQGGKYKEVHSMLIYKDNKLVLEEYFYGHKYKWDAPYHHGEMVKWNKYMVHDVCSVAKSITSALAGIAVDQGFIKSVNQSIFDYLPDHKYLAKDGKEKITIEHILTMTCGLEWPEWSAPYSSMDNPIIEIWFQEKDPIGYILKKPIKYEPGTKFNYSTGNMIVLGEIIQNATGMKIDDFSEKYLIKPLMIDSFGWYLKYKNGVDGNDIKTTPRAMTKIGALYLNKGVWNGKIIVSEEWVNKSAVPYAGNTRINVPGEDSGIMGYSYTWWTKTYSVGEKKIHLYTASGFGGQHIMVLPEANTVVVFTSGNFLSHRPNFKILKKYILPALKNSF